MANNPQKGRDKNSSRHASDQHGDAQPDRDDNQPDVANALTGAGAASTIASGVGSTAGLGAGGGYDVQGNLGSVDTAANHPDPGAAYETTSAGRGTGRGRDGAPAGAAGGGMGGGGTGGLTDVGGAASRQGISNPAGSTVGHGNDIAPTAGGVSVSAGRGSDLGDADHGLTRERGGLSGGSFGGSNEQETGGGLSGSMRGQAGADVSGGMGGSRSGQRHDPAEGSNDVSTNPEPGGVNERTE